MNNGTKCEIMVIFCSGFTATFIRVRDGITKRLLLNYFLSEPRVKSDAMVLLIALRYKKEGGKSHQGCRREKMAIDFCQYTIRQLSIFKAFDQEM